MTWKTVLIAVLKSLAAQGGYWALIASLIIDYILPLLPDAESFDFVSASSGTKAAPDDFKSAVKTKLLSLAAGVSRPFIRMALTIAINQLTDAVLDQAWDLLFGTKAEIVMASDEASKSLLVEIAKLS